MSKISRSALVKINYLTSTGLEKIRLELDFLKRHKRHDVAERIQKAREDGNVEENAEYEAALDEQALVENRIITLEEVLRKTLVIDEKSPHTVITLGSTVTVDIEGDVNEFTIVGKFEANPLQKRISDESPVGSMLIGAKVGEEKLVTTPANCFRCKVLNIK